MALFEYTQVSRTGQECRGVVVAPSLGEARRRLRTAGSMSAVVAKRSRPRRGNPERLPHWRRDLAAATRQLAVILLAGVLSSGLVG
jgi:type II secretory pathway component PulF